MIVIGGIFSSTATESALREFRKLAEFGCVGSGWPKGHKDGWGAAAYRKGRLIKVMKRSKDAFRDPEYPRFAKRISATPPEILMMHFRKASVGSKTLANTHPFAMGNFALCHNGSIRQSERISVPSSMRRFMKGKTDTERLFLRFMAHARAATLSNTAIRTRFMQEVRNIRRSLDYTAMNILFSNGATIWALRDVNLQNDLVRKERLMGYYTLYFGSGGKGIQFAIASETLPVRGMRWRLMKNRELVEIDVARGTWRTYRT